MTDAPMGYSTVHLGLNNQKLALLGLCERAMTAKRPIVLPRLSLFDPTKTEHATVPLADIFSVSDLRRYCEAFDIGIVDADSPNNETGWGCFIVGSGAATRHARRGLAALGDFVCQFFDHLVPLVACTPEFRSLNDIIFNTMNIKTVIQLRIEKDWIEYSDRHLQKHAESGEEYVPTFQEIMAKVRNTPELPSKLAYVVCDEANLPVDKDEIRQEVKARFDITLVWKSDFLSAFDLSKFSILELALIDFEMAMRAPGFVGVSRSSFSDLVTFEKFSRTRQPVKSHFIYNVRGPALGQRMDNGAEVVPSKVVNRLGAREMLLSGSEEDCRWPVTLTAHIARLGDFVSETSPFVGVRGGPLVCGVRGSEIGALIEGFSIEVGTGVPVRVEYRALLEDGVWTPWLTDGAYAGTRGAGRQIAGYAVRLVGSLAARFQCVCAGSFAGQEEIVISEWGEPCQAANGAKLEAMQIAFRPAMRHWTAFTQTDDPAIACGATETSLGPDVRQPRTESWDAPR